MDELIKAYKESMYKEEAACSDLDGQIFNMQTSLDLLKAKRSELAKPFEAERNDILAEIEPVIKSLGKTYKCDAGTISFRKGTKRVTYDWVRVDAVRGALGAILPDLAAQLDDARQEGNSWGIVILNQITKLGRQRSSLTRCGIGGFESHSPKLS